MKKTLLFVTIFALCPAALLGSKTAKRQISKSLPNWTRRENGADLNAEDKKNQAQQEERQLRRVSRKAAFNEAINEGLEDWHNKRGQPFA